LYRTSGDFNLTVVDNGSTDGTAEYLGRLKHPKLHHVIINPKNRGLHLPTSEFWGTSKAKYVGKIDNDTLVKGDWIQRLVNILESNENVAIVGCWHFFREDFVLGEDSPRIKKWEGGAIFENRWIGGTAYLMRRELVARFGFLDEKDGVAWTTWQTRVSDAGFLVGWAHPLVLCEHMDDVRHPLCALKSDEDCQGVYGISYKTRGLRTIGSIQEWIEKDCRQVQGV